MNSQSDSVKETVNWQGSAPPHREGFPPVPAARHKTTDPDLATTHVGLRRRASLRLLEKGARTKPGLLVLACVCLVLA